MEADLVQRLRTCSAEERRNIATALAKTGTDEAVDELIRMVEGKRRHWLRFYNPDDQLLGVEALGETHNRFAMQYLERVYTPRTHTSSMEYSSGGGSEPRDDENHTLITAEITYPRARKGLAQQLSYTERRQYCTSRYEEPKIDTYPKQNNAHTTFITAIAKLEIYFNEIV